MVKKTSLYIEEDLLKKLKIIAVEQGRKVNELIIEAIEEKYCEEGA